MRSDDATPDRKAGRLLSASFTSACAFGGGPELIDLVDQARHDGAGDATVTFALVDYAQNAAHNGPDEADHAALEVADVIVRRQWN